MSETINNDAESTSKVPTSWPISARVEYLEKAVAHLLESHKDMLEYLVEAITAVREISNDSAEE
tara:strand:+ start:1402 stop:1593 length:192 start_codon:yes stop_codon:yes gene_type:complete